MTDADLNLTFLQGQRFVVLGLGKTGLSVAEAFQRFEIPYTAWDDDSAKRSTAAAKGVTVMENPEAILAGEIQNYNGLVLSPGIPTRLEKAPPIVLATQRANITIFTDIDIFLQAVPDVPIIGITGTNGKSTTTALIGHILKESGRKVAIGGNIGIPALELPRLEADGIYVLELSSYQLELCPNLRSDISVLLNITEDHLAYHGDMATYIKAKVNLLLAPPTMGNPNAPPPTAVIGLDTDICVKIAESEYNRKARNLITLAPIDSLEEIEPCMNLHYTKNAVWDGGDYVLDLSENPSLQGIHNAQNAAAALAVCRASGLTDSQIKAAIATFQSLPHRQEVLIDNDKLLVINDSKATSSDATAKALVCYDNIHWIVGGRAKTDGLTGLEAYLPRIEAAYLIGESSDRYQEWFMDNGAAFSVIPANTLEVATELAFAAAAKAAVLSGARQVILLSPAATSWDQFTSFEDRGEKFRQLVQRYKPS